jgi:hypothetical protein
MQQFRIRIFLTESQFTDTVIMAENWFTAQAIGQGQSPVGKALLLN